MQGAGGGAAPTAASGAGADAAPAGEEKKEEKVEEEEEEVRQADSALILRELTLEAPLAHPARRTWASACSTEASQGAGAGSSTRRRAAAGAAALCACNALTTSPAEVRVGVLPAVSTCLQGCGAEPGHESGQSVGRCHWCFDRPSFTCSSTKNITVFQVPSRAKFGPKPL